MRRAAVLAALAALPGTAGAANQCHLVDVELTPVDHLQMVAWIEKADGTYVDTIYITQTTGRYGLGNRPGRFDFNSGPLWPYGRRVMVLPVWAHRKTPATFPEVIFQSSPDDPDECSTMVNDSTGNHFAACGENDLSHSSGQSSNEHHYCQPLQPNTDAWTATADTLTCATPNGTPSGAFSDKGRFSPVRQNPYPPRADVIRDSETDDPAVETYKQMNPFDAISHATPAGGADTHLAWPIPPGLPDGQYVLWIETSLEGDFNATYNATSFPSPPGDGPQGISFARYGQAFRGQPSIVYKVPFSIGQAEDVETTSTYAGYGDPDGASGALNPPDATITTDTPGTGVARLELVAGSDSYRVKVDARPEQDAAPPDQPARIAAHDVTSTGVTLSFVAPGDDGAVGTVSSYELYLRAGSPLTPDNLADAMTQKLPDTIAPVAAGQLQTVALTGLLPFTDYWIGVRAVDKCGNDSPLAIAHVQTADRRSGEVDACFIATAAYGSLMANDVDQLRHFRDAVLSGSVLGELAVETYYTFGPPVAGVVGESELLRATARDVLAPIIARVRRLVY